jgi:hypothetical protein
MAETLTNARKYRISLTLAHHELQQLERNKDVASAVMSNPFARIVFRVGDGDAKRLAEGFSYFEAQDLRNLEAGHAICRVERSDYDFNLKVPLPDEPDERMAAMRRQEVITASRKKYGTLKTGVEAMLAAARTGQGEVSAPPPQRTPAAPVPETDSKPEASEETVSEKKIVEPPRDLGRGGAQHQAIQQRIKKAAEELGFRSVIEKPVLDKLGSIDLLIERDGQGIACEISISTTIDHEVLNVSKCLKAGFSMVAVICLDGERLKKIEDAVSGSLGPELAGRVRFFQPDPFIEYLKQLKAPAAAPSEAIVSGYKIRRSTRDHSPQERRQKEDIANRVIAEAMRKKGP